MPWWGVPNGGKALLFHYSQLARKLDDARSRFGLCSSPCLPPAKKGATVFAPPSFSLVTCSFFPLLPLLFFDLWVSLGTGKDAGRNGIHMAAGSDPTPGPEHTLKAPARFFFSAFNIDFPHVRNVFPTPPFGISAAREPTPLPTPPPRFDPPDQERQQAGLARHPSTQIPFGGPLPKTNQKATPSSPAVGSVKPSVIVQLGRGVSISQRRVVNNPAVGGAGRRGSINRPPSLQHELVTADDRRLEPNPRSPRQLGQNPFDLDTIITPANG